MEGKEETKKISPMDVYKHLPQTNCGECGIKTCMGFAVRVLKREAYLKECTPLGEPKNITHKIELKKLLSVALEAKETQLIIYGELCNGCGNCVVACPVNASCSIETSGGKGPLTEEVVMDIGNGAVVELNLGACRRAKDDAESEPCRICMDVCPFNAIEFM